MAAANPDGGHSHQFNVKFLKDAKLYTVGCDQPAGVLEAIKTQLKEQYVEKINCPDENILIQIGTGDKESCIATHFPCCCLEENETVSLSVYKKVVEKTNHQSNLKEEEEKRIDLRSDVKSRKNYSVFYISKDGGTNAKSPDLFVNNVVKKSKYLCVYGVKRMTVEEALRNDGRFCKLDDFELCNEDRNATDKTTVCKTRVEWLNGKKFKINLPKQKKTDGNPQANREQKEEQDKQEEPSTSTNVQSKERPRSNKTNQKGGREKKVVKKKSNSFDMDAIYKILQQQFPRLKEWLEKRFPDDSFNDTLEERKGTFGHVEQSFSKVHTIKGLMQLSDSVCLLEVQNPYGSVQGTGFVLFDNFVLTNAHLFEYWIKSNLDKWWEKNEFRALFNYEKEKSEASTFKAKVVRWEQNNADYGLLELDRQNCEPPTANIPPGLLNGLGPVPHDGAACIIGHPGGQVKKIDLMCVIEKEEKLKNYNEPFIPPLRSIHPGMEAGKVNYSTFMVEGSSGSPVFNAVGKVFALHTGWRSLGEKKEGNEDKIEYGFSLQYIFRQLVTTLNKDGHIELLQKIQLVAEKNRLVKCITDSVTGQTQASGILSEVNENERVQAEILQTEAESSPMECDS